MADPYPVTLDSKDFTLAANGALDEVAATEVITASNHNLIQSAIVELEEKVGITSSADSSSIDYLLKSTSSGDPGHLHTKVGTIATGVWNGTAIADEYGGTGQTTYAEGDILYASGADTLTKLAKGDDDDVLTLASGLPEWAEAGGGSSAFTEAVTISAEDADPLLIITQTAPSATGTAPFLKFGDTSHTLEWKKSGNGFLLSHSAGSASILMQNNSTVTIGGVLAVGTASVTGVRVNGHGGIYGYGGSKIHVYPTGSAPLIIGSNTSSNNVLQVFFEAIPVNFQVNVRHHGIAGITASTSQSQGNGPLTADVNVIATVGSANDTCTMPTAVAWMRVTVINNDGANTMRLYPASGDDLGAGVDAYTTLAAGSNITYQAIDAVNWEVV